MQTVSSASRTCIAAASAVEWTATVLIPISRQARWIRSAISPRLAIRTFSNMASTMPSQPSRAEREGTRRNGDGEVGAAFRPSICAWGFLHPTPPLSGARGGEGDLQRLLDGEQHPFDVFHYIAIPE